MTTPRVRARVATRQSDAAAFRWLLSLVVLGALLVAAASAARARSAPDSFADVVEGLMPTVVNIATTQNGTGTPEFEEFEEFFRDFFERRGIDPTPRQSTSLGSGFIIDPDGYIVTNNHVIENADEITVRLHDDTELKAIVVGRDEKTDLAVLKVESPTPLPAAQWGDSEAIRVGDWVIAIGNPLGLGGTVTAGIISAKQRDIHNGPYDDFLQTDASINRGNSGGPMFNSDGEVIGINTAIFSPSGGSIGIGFAIPSSIAQNVAEQILEFGVVRRGWLGVRIQTVTEELAEGMLLDEAAGALVAAVTPGGPAEGAGIQQGDVILRFDDRSVDEMRRLPRLVAETRIGSVVDVVVWRDGAEQVVQVEIGALDEEEIASTGGGGRTSRRDDAAQPELESDLGLALAPLSAELRERYSIDESVNGVVVTQVDDAGSAAERGVRQGDVIVEVDRTEVADPADVDSGIDQARDAGSRVVTLLLFREGDFRWVAVRIDGSE